MDEVPKPGNRDSRGEPLYRGSEAALEISQLTESEPLRMRILALDENETILKRSMVRTTATDDHEYPSLTWITDGDNFDFRIDELENQEIASTSESMNVTWTRGDIPSVTDGSIESRISTTPNADFINLSVGDPRVLNDPGPHALEQDSSLQDLPVLSWRIENPGIEPVETESGDLQQEFEAISNNMNAEVSFQGFSWRAFIAEEYVQATFPCGGTSPGEHRFGGDNRDFRPEAVMPPSRVGAGFNFYFDNQSVLERYQIQETRLYRWEDGGAVLLGSERAPVSDIQLSGTSINQNAGRGVISIASSNPLCHILGFFDAPDINIDVDVELFRDGTVYASGRFDRAPHHEAYVHTFYADHPRSIQCLVQRENSGFHLLPFPGIPFDFHPGPGGEPATC
ncbi:hypothetical protein J4H86_06420 [Spiractinospora alimapuensis]|uniref:hypothetical protein n=1 Tax=Spiractinospora alimapuensis TaxID=2820884 RepID=UPI001F28121D|nr:hypothetical protein [Spiractinospora alimapuensis]QVQ53390.1 hypothetical protein J4H86_06420 [Spiractinospora alimapuensis]